PRVVEEQPGERALLVHAARTGSYRIQSEIDIRLVIPVLCQISIPDAGIRVDVVARRHVFLFDDSLRDAVHRNAILHEYRDGAILRVPQEFGADGKAWIGAKPRDVAVIVERAGFGSGGCAAEVEGRVCAIERTEESVLNAVAVDVASGDDAVIVDTEHGGRHRTVRWRDGDKRGRVCLGRGRQGEN